MPLWGKTDVAGSKPKHLSTADEAKVVFVDVEEASNPANRLKGIKTPGWTLFDTYEDSGGNVRYKVEPLVSLSVAASDSGDGSDDAVVGDVNLRITTQPAKVTVDEGDNAVFTVVVADPSGATPSYQWQVKAVGSSTYANVTGETTDTLTITTTLADSGNKYRVLVLSTDTTASVTSKVVTLTVN